MPRVNRKTAYEREQVAPYFSRSSKDPLASWRISGIKVALFEQWYFDSVSNDGKSSICIIFARDASYALLGHGHLRMEIDVVFPDGSHFNHADWISESVIEDSSQDHGAENARKVESLWTGAGTRHSFTIASDGSSAHVDLQGQNIQGSFTLRSTAPAHYPGGKTHAEAGDETPTALCPKINLVEVIPCGTFEASLVVNGQPLQFQGIGGHMHVWAEGSWFDTVRGWRMCRAAARPFNLTFMQWSSLLDGRTYSSGFVAESGKKAFGALEITDDPAGGPEEKNVVRWQPQHNLGTTGPHQDKNSGSVLRYKSTRSGEEYRFELFHKHVAFSVNFGGGNSDLTGFLSEVSGGKVGEESYRGPAFANVCVLPRKSPTAAAQHGCKLG